MPVIRGLGSPRSYQPLTFTNTNTRRTFLFIHIFYPLSHHQDDFSVLAILPTYLFLLVQKNSFYPAILLLDDVTCL